MRLIILQPGEKGETGDTGDAGESGDTGSKGGKGEPNFVKGDMGEKGQKGQKGKFFDEIPIAPEVIMIDIIYGYYRLGNYKITIYRRITRILSNETGSSYGFYF